jgi:hypothetical protein
MIKCLDTLHEFSNKVSEIRTTTHKCISYSQIKHNTLYLLPKKPGTTFFIEKPRVNLLKQLVTNRTLVLTQEK